MNTAQHHRGPDDRGIVECVPQRVVLGNTRLAIIDTSPAGHQPMNDPGTGNTITYNGEVYNFRDLRRELDSNWSSNTDTEVVLRAYDKWGDSAPGKLRGMFALAIWDDQKQQLVLARDPLGIKPLYYFLAKDRLLFASELRALLASNQVPRRLSQAAVDSYLANGSVTAPLTIVDGVRQLLPGYVAQASVNESGGIELSEHRYTTDRAPESVTNRIDAVARLRSELEESVRLHLVSDVPLGLFLSGGMDSSALVALMSRVTNERPKTFSVVFSESDYTEAPFSRAVSQKFRTDHREIGLSEDRLLQLLPEAIAAIDQPTMDGLNTFVVSQAVKQAGATVALSGLGGDELFAGYPSFRRALRIDSASPASRRLLRAAAGVGQVALNGSVQRHKFWQLVKSDGAPEDVYRISRQLFAPDRVAQVTGRDVRPDPRAANGTHGEGDVVNTISRLELNGYMTNTLLRDTDAMSMAHSLEVRVPFVDVKVVDYVMSLPGDWKLRDKPSGPPKALLADALSDLLPREFLARPKMGFTLPFEKWLQRNLRAEVDKVLGDEDRLSQAGLLPGGVRDTWNRFLAKPRAVGWSRPWSLYVLARWCEVNRVAA
jgi:asparagine synthase (glutamine-hydrolysing)